MDDAQDSVDFTPTNTIANNRWRQIDCGSNPLSGKAFVQVERTTLSTGVANVLVIDNFDSIGGLVLANLRFTGTESAFTKLCQRNEIAIVEISNGSDGFTMEARFHA